MPASVSGYIHTYHLYRALYFTLLLPRICSVAQYTSHHITSHRCGRASPALIKVVAATGGHGQGGAQLLRPAVYRGEGEGGADLASVSSWKVLSWVENERFGLVSEFDPDNFTR